MAEGSDQTETQAQAILARLEEFTKRAEIAAAVAEQASAKANSESGFAYNAKQNSEDHAKVISQIRGTVEADSTWWTTTKQNADALTTAIATAKTAVENDENAIAELRKQSEIGAGLVKTASDKVNTALPTVDRSIAHIAGALESATNSVSEIGVKKSAIDAVAIGVNNIQTQLNEIAAKVNADAASIAKSEVEGKSKLASLLDAVAEVKAMQANVEKYEKQLTAQTHQWKELHTKIEGLLPHATSAGLASAFHSQKSRFAAPQTYWLIAFVVAIGALLVAGLSGIPASDDRPWDGIIRHFVGRLPIVVPLVWLGIFAGRNYMMALRVQEEYAFKEAVSTAFEGYKRELGNIGSSGGISPLVNFCENTLRILARRPGQIYEGKHEDITPLTPVTQTLANAAQSLVNGKPAASTAPVAATAAPVITAPAASPITAAPAAAQPVSASPGAP